MIERIARAFHVPYDVAISIFESSRQDIWLYTVRYFHAFPYEIRNCYEF